MQNNQPIHFFEQTLTALSFILFPAIFIFAFANHPGLLTPHMMNPQELIYRVHHADLLQFAHVLVTLSTIPLIAIALHFKRLLAGTTSAWFGLIGAVIAIAGAVFLAVDKGALCLTMSAFDTVSEANFSAAMPAILSLFEKQSWMVLAWGIVLLPIGFAIQTIGLLKSSVLPRWQSGLFLAGVLLVATPDGMEIVNLTASVLMAAALIPYGLKLLNQRNRI